MDLDKKVVEALIADRIGIEGAEAAYAELKDQICAVGSGPSWSDTFIRPASAMRRGMRAVHH